MILSFHKFYLHGKKIKLKIILPIVIIGHVFCSDIQYRTVLLCKTRSLELSFLKLFVQRLIK